MIEIATGACLSLEGSGYQPAKMLSFLVDLQQLVRVESRLGEFASPSSPADSNGPAGRLMGVMGVVDASLVRELTQQGVSPEGIDWVVPLARLELRYGEVLGRVYLAQARGLGPFLFASDGQSEIRLFRDINLTRGSTSRRRGCSWSRRRPGRAP